MKKAALDALQNEKFVLGESVFRFEEEFAKYCGAKYAVSTSSGTDALHFALIALDVKAGHEVVATPVSFIATANVILYVNAIPVFADIELGTYDLDPRQVKEKVTRKTKAVIPVHLYGYPADMDAIAETSDRHGLHVVEDACQAHGAVYKGRRVGTFGDVGCFSFYPSKNLTVCGDGGMLITDDEEIIQKVAKIRDCGRRSKYVHDALGYTARLNTVNAAIGLVQLKHLDKWNKKRQKNSELYNRLFSDLDDLVLPPTMNSEVKPVYHLYVIRSKHRDKLKQWLEKNEIECGIHYELPIHLQPLYRELFGYRGGEYPNSEQVCKTCLSIPMHPHLTRDEIRFVSEKIHEFFNDQIYEGDLQ